MLYGIIHNAQEQQQEPQPFISRFNLSHLKHVGTLMSSISTFMYQVLPYNLFVI